MDQSPSNLASADSLTDFDGVLNAAYYYQLGGVTPLAVMAEFRSDNALMFEAPYTEFDTYTSNLTTMEDQFFGPLYTAMYKSILSANNVIGNRAPAAPNPVGGRYSSGFYLYGGIYDYDLDPEFHLGNDTAS